jgi:hypothetical protein
LALVGCAPILTVALALLGATPDPVGSGPDVSQDAFEFGEVRQGTTVEHAFPVRNDGAAPLRIERVMVTPPLVVRRMPALVQPGRTAEVAVALPTATLDGPFTGDVLVRTSAGELAFALRGRVVGPIEIAPGRALFLSGTRDAPGSGALEIVSHEEDPIRIDRVEQTGESFTIRLDPVEEGRRWRLVVSLRPDGPAGRRTDRITLRTTSRRAPSPTIVAHSYLRERVYTFPDSVDLGAIPLSLLRRGGAIAERLAQTLMVYQVGGTDFHARLSSSIPSLRLRSERGPKGDRYQATVTIAPEELSPGPIRGTIDIETDDPAFPRIAVPVSGTILDG